MDFGITVWTRETLTKTTSMKTCSSEVHPYSPYVITASEASV